MTCENFGKNGENEIIPAYSWFFENETSNMTYCATVMMERMKRRKKIIENG